MGKEQTPQTQQTPRRSTRSSVIAAAADNEEKMGKEETPQSQQTPRRSTRSPVIAAATDNEEKMAKEETLQTPQSLRRSTRSSVIAAAMNNEVETKKLSQFHKLTLNDLVFGGEDLSLKDLFARFPGRSKQIHELLHLLGVVNSPMLPLLVYGGPSTGKTSVVLEIFRHLKRPFVYASCRTCYSPRILFENILNQLSLHRRSEGNGYVNAKRCEKPSDLMNFVREALVSVIGNLKGNVGKVKSEKVGEWCNGTMIYVVIDNIELIRGWDKSSSLISLIFKLYDMLNMPEVGIVFINSTSPDTHIRYFEEAIPVYFPEYMEEDLHQIFLKNQADRKNYSSFLELVVGPFCRVTRRMDEVSTSFSALFSKYCEPLNDLHGQSHGEMKRRLFGHFQPHIAPALNEIFWVASNPALGTESCKEMKQKNSKRKSIEGADSEIDFHMSVSAKYLLISAFIASRNPATLDASLFDSYGGSDSRKRKRKAYVKSMEQEAAAEQEQLMKGPGAFPLERLLAIFQCITLSEVPINENENDSVETTDGGDGGLMCDVLLQLSSLCNANFIVKGGSCPLEGSTRYRSTVSEDLALKVARSLKFPLANYLYRR